MLFLGRIKEKVACVDTSFVGGDFLKMARDYKVAKSKRDLNYKIQIKPDKRLKEILEQGVVLLITAITKYEILAEMVFKEGLNFDDANRIYLTVQNTYKNLQDIKGIDRDILQDDCICKSIPKLKNNNKSIGLLDVINIEIAKNAEMPIITSERKSQVWKLLYDKAYSQDEAWKLFRKRI